MRSGLPLAAALSIAAFASANPARPETVDCTKADISAEFAICNSESLQDLDTRLDTAFRKLELAATNKPERQKIEREQASWTVRRDACKADMACLAMRYQERILDIDNGTSANPSSLLGFTGQ